MFFFRESGALRIACLTLLFACAAVRSDIFASDPSKNQTPAASSDEGVKTYHAIAARGQPKYGPDFKHFDYVNPNAPKGGGIVMVGDSTGFDSVNPLSIKGSVPSNFVFPNINLLITDSLMAHSMDEILSMYGLIAQSVEVPADQSWAVFNLNPAARFQDGSPITAEDVLFSYETLIKQQPKFSSYYGDVASVKILDPQRIRFDFKTKNNPELIAVVAELPVFSKKFWNGKNLDEPVLTPWISSGPYKISVVDPGRSYTLERVKDYWAANLPVRKGMHNFDTIRYDYYKDDNVRLEALKSGQVDFRVENTAKLWASAYDIPAVKNKILIKENIPTKRHSPMQGWVFNQRREKFQDPRVREALLLAYDFETTNRTLMHDAYKRQQSYWSNSDLGSSGLPQGTELALLQEFKDQLPEKIFTQEFKLPINDGVGKSVRTHLKLAQELLKQAGWEVKNGVLVNAKTNEPFTLEFLLANKGFEPMVLAYFKNLEILGIKGAIKLVDAPKFKEQVTQFDFDMIIDVYPLSDSPGNELKNILVSESANQKGTRNYGGIQNPVVDALVEKIIYAQTRDDLVAASKALDRVMLWNYYCIPNYYLDYDRVAFWDKFDRPKQSDGQLYERYSVVEALIPLWWVNSDKASLLDIRKKQIK